MQFMSQTFHSPKLEYFFPKSMPLEILTLSGVLFYHVKIIFLLLYVNRSCGAKSMNESQHSLDRRQ